MSGEVSFFEIGVEDPGQARAFYGGLFDWSFEPGPTGEGFVIGTAGMFGGVHGGDKGASPYVFFRVDDMEAALERVRELGGSEGEIEMDAGEEGEARFGRFKLCKDDQGSSFGLHQPPG